MLKLPSSFVLAMLLSLVACDDGASVASGEIGDETFEVTDVSPELRKHRSSHGFMVIMAEADKEAQQLRTVSIRLPNDALLAPGTLNVGKNADEAWIELSEGLLEVDDNPVGGQVISSSRPALWEATSGTVELFEVRTVLSGQFEAEFGDFGHLEGKFEVDWGDDRPTTPPREGEEKPVKGAEPPR